MIDDRYIMIYELIVLFTLVSTEINVSYNKQDFQR